MDRGDFFPNSEREIAYKDMAWKESDPVSGPIHLSAPCIYANALEFLDLQPGMSFLNFGSGTGYLNTLAGFLLSKYCFYIIYKDVILYLLLYFS